MKHTMKLPTLVGLLSATAMLGACSLSQPYGGGNTTYGWSGSKAHAPAYGGSSFRSSAAVVQGPNTRTYYAPRIDAGYSAQPTTIGAHAPYGAATHYSGYGYGARPRLRPASYGYGSIGATLYDLDSDTAGVQGRFGYQFTPLFGVEGEGSIGVLDDETTVGATTTENSINYQVAGFGLAKLPIGNRFSVHARGGYHTTEAETKTTVGAATNTVKADSDGFAYGAGAEYRITPVDSLRLDNTHYDIHGPNNNLDTVSMAYQRLFKRD
ncbi:MAG: porin family protein, partial [Pseudomonadota bacterium]